MKNNDSAWRSARLPKPRLDLATKQEIPPSIDQLVAEWTLGAHDEIDADTIDKLEQASAALRECIRRPRT